MQFAAVGDDCGVVVAAAMLGILSILACGEVGKGGAGGTGRCVNSKSLLRLASAFFSSLVALPPNSYL